ncbi:MAG: hypothetical protein P4L84_38080 [Isosphaeraceae bacterium]|nr:hypothetical protein [Isosphaeraceae bacterium]
MRRKALLLAASLLPAWGCGESVERLEPVPLEQLPPGSLEAATKAVRGFKADRARKSKFNGQDAIEIIGKDKSGKIVEVEVSTDGKVLEVE